MLKFRSNSLGDAADTDFASSSALNWVSVHDNVGCSARGLFGSVGYCLGPGVGLLGLGVAASPVGMGGKEEG